MFYSGLITGVGAVEVVQGLESLLLCFPLLAPIDPLGGGLVNSRLVSRG